MAQHVFWETDGIHPPILAIEDVALFISEMKKAGLALPHTLSKEDIPKPAELAQTFAGARHNPYRQIMDRIAVAGTISLSLMDADDRLLNPST